MRSFSADDPFYARYPSQIRPGLTSFADEVCATVARLFAYVGVIALFGILGVHAWDQLQLEDRGEEPSLKAGWSVAERASPAFVLNRRRTSKEADGSESYLVLRHPSGGRKDIMRWSGPDHKPLAELEIYRPGAEYGSAAAARAELAGRMHASGSSLEGLESAGAIETRFGSVALLRPTGGSEGYGSCVGFFKRIDDPALQISGWSCQGDSLPSRRAAIDCMLSQLRPLTATIGPELAQLFARTAPEGGSCAAVTGSGEWINGADAPTLRGSL